MKTTFTPAWICVLLAALWLSATLPARAELYTWHPRSPADVVREVRDFEGQPDLAVTVTDRPDFSREIPSHDVFYRLRAGRYSYSVSAFGSAAFSRRDEWLIEDKDQFYGEPYNQQILAPRQIGREAAEKIARSFLAAHCPQPKIYNIMTFREDAAGWQQVDGAPPFIESYSFRFHSRLPNGVYAPNYRSITVDAVQGRIIRYFSKDFPVLIGTEPRLTGEQAVAAALQAMGCVSNGTPPEIRSLCVSVPDTLGMQSLLYDVAFEGYLPGAGPDNAWKWSAYVDAATGQPFDIDIVVGIGNPDAGAARRPKPRAAKPAVPAAPVKPLPFLYNNVPCKLNVPPVTKGGVPFIYGGYLAAMDTGVKMRYDSGEVSVQGDKNARSFKVNSREYSYNGSKYTGADAPVIIAGRCYIPVSLLTKRLAGAWSYDKKAGAVHFKTHTGGRL